MFSHARSTILWVPTLVLIAMASLPLSGEEVPVEEAAKFLRILATTAGSEGRVACKELDMVIQMKKQGISVDAKANIAWAFTSSQTKFYVDEKKLVICNSRKLFANGGAIAFERVNGRLVILYHQENLEKSGVHLPDSFLRSAVKV